MTTERVELFAMSDDELITVVQEAITAMEHVIAAHGREAGPFLGIYRRAHAQYKDAREVLNIRCLPYCNKRAHW